MDLETLYVARDRAYRSLRAGSLWPGAENLILVDAPAGAQRVWYLQPDAGARPYVTADWATAWRLYEAGAGQPRPLDVVG